MDPLSIGVGVLMATTAAVTGPVLLPMIGFTTAGITAGSTAASFMSLVYAKGVGIALLSAAQSAGAVGTVGAANIGVMGAFGYAATYAFQLVL